MSIQWRCIKCETTMLSKCPAQRNIHCEGSNESRAIACNTAMHIIRMEAEHNEVVLRTTVFDNASDQAAILLKVLEYAGAKADPIAVTQAYCDHYWVIDDLENRTCTLGCEHNNWSDRERLLAELKNVEIPKPTPESVDRDIYRAISPLLDEYQNYLVRNQSAQLSYDEKRTAYCRIADSTYVMKHILNKNMTAIREGRPIQPMYQVNVGKEKIECNSKEMLTAVVRGLLLQGIEHYVLKLRDGYSGYDSCDEEISIVCGICGQFIENDYVSHDGVPVHPACKNKALNALKVKSRKLRWNPDTERLKHDYMAKFEVLRQIVPYKYHDMIANVSDRTRHDRNDRIRKVEYIIYMQGTQKDADSLQQWLDEA